MPPEKKVSNLYQSLNNQKALINLKDIVNSEEIPTEIDKINEQLERLLARATSAEKFAYQELNKEGAVDKKELELKKTKHLKVDNKEEKWKHGLTEEHERLIVDSESKDKLFVNVGKIEKYFQFRTDFYKAAEITSSLENDQLIDKYRKIKGISGERAGLIYKDGWKDPDEVDEDGIANLDKEKDGYRYDVQSTSRLQAEIMNELQTKIDEAREKVNTATPEQISSLLKELLNFNEKWIEEGKDDSAKKAREGALYQKKTRLDQVLRELTEKEIQSICDDMSDPNKYGSDYNRLEELVGDRIEALDDEFTDSKGRSKSFLNETKKELESILKFRADFLEGNEGEEISDEFIYKYRNKGLSGKQAGQVYREYLWTDPEEIDSSGYANLRRENRDYPFLVLSITRQEAEKRVAAEEKLREVVYRPEIKDDLEKLKSHLKELEDLIPKDESAGDQTTPIQYAYRYNKEATDSKRKNLEEAIDNLQRKSFINEIDSSVQKINTSIRGQGVELIEDDSTSENLSDYKKWINDKNTDLEEVENWIKNGLTVEIKALLVKRLEKLCQIEPKINYEDIGITTSIQSNFANVKTLSELAAKGARIANKIVNIRNDQKKNDLENAADILKNLINKEVSENLEELRLDLNNFQDLIPIEPTGGKSITGRQLTPAEMEAYKENRDEADEKELNLLKKITKLEGKDWNPPLSEKEWEEVEKINNRTQFWITKSQLTHEREIERVLEESKKTLEDEQTQKDQLLGLIYTLDAFGECRDEEWGQEKAWRNKEEKVKEVIKKLKVKVAGLKFDEYIGEIAEENSPSVLNKLGEKWTEYLRQQEISNEEMPAGKRKKDLLAAIEKRKSAIEKGELAKTKTEAEKIAEARNEADGLKKRIRNFQEELKRRNITSEENNWDEKTLEVIDERDNLQKIINNAEKILGISLKSLGNKTPSLANFSEIASSLTKIGVVLEKDEDDRNYYDSEKLGNRLSDLISKEKENESLSEAIKNKEEKISQLIDELGTVRGEKDSLSKMLSQIGENEENLRKDNGEVRKTLGEKENELKAINEKNKSQEKIIQELTEKLNNSKKQVDDLQVIIAENANKEEELKKTQMIIELLRVKLINELGEETEAKIETLAKSNNYK